jgi:GH24 family phage-related lysozyme (muramidase)
MASTSNTPNTPNPPNFSLPANPNLSLRLSSQGRSRLREREGLRGYYHDGGGDLGHCTFGIGMLVHRGPCSAEDMQRQPTLEEIEGSFAAAVRSAELAVLRQVCHQALSQAQFDALVSYTFNLGAGGAMLALRRVDAGDLGGAADVMERNVHSRIDGKLVRLAALVTRRSEESAPLRGLA